MVVDDLDGLDDDGVDVDCRLDDPGDAADAAGVANADDDEAVGGVTTLTDDFIFSFSLST